MHNVVVPHSFETLCPIAVLALRALVVCVPGCQVSRNVLVDYYIFHFYMLLMGLVAN